jgi:hypothetical protein
MNESHGSVGYDPSIFDYKARLCTLILAASAVIDKLSWKCLSYTSGNYKKNNMRNMLYIKMLTNSRSLTGGSQMISNFE